jgi:hypothetical protein
LNAAGDTGNNGPLTAGTEFSEQICQGRKEYEMSRESSRQGRLYATVAIMGLSWICNTWAGSEGLGPGAGDGHGSGPGQTHTQIAQAASRTGTPQRLGKPTGVVQPQSVDGISRTLAEMQQALDELRMQAAEARTMAAEARDIALRAERKADEALAAANRP